MPSLGSWGDVQEEEGHAFSSLPVGVQEGLWLVPDSGRTRGRGGRRGDLDHQAAILAPPCTS